MSAVISNIRKKHAAARLLPTYIYIKVVSRNVLVRMQAISCGQHARAFPPGCDTKTCL